jgi:4-diphosphocytidyl-2-C-methyl-D-erythritol kinase
MRSVTVLAPAKINLGLHVLGKRRDGYHEIETILQTVSLYDEIAIEEGGEGVRLSTDHPDLAAGEENLIVRAANLLSKEVGREEPLQIRLVKRIPIGAGLGGGSSDAAATLAALNRLWGSPVSSDRLMQLAVQLGMDVPFFLFSATALASGRGELLEKLPSPSPPLWILLVNPGLYISTQSVYNGLKLGLTIKNKHISIRRFSVTSLRRHRSLLQNDLERVTFEQFPLLKEIKERILERGAVGAAMSGSGSTLFGIFSDRESATQAEWELGKKKGLSVYRVNTLDALCA